MQLDLTTYKSAKQLNHEQTQALAKAEAENRRQRRQEAHERAQMEARLRKLMRKQLVQAKAPKEEAKASEEEFKEPTPHTAWCKCDPEYCESCFWCDGRASKLPW